MIYNSQDMEASSAEEWLKMRYIYTMEYYSTIKQNKIMSFAATWLDLEIVRAKIGREDKCHTVSLICGI